jgi:SulP family sulfate permease
MLAGTVGAMAGGDPQHYAEIASLTAFTVALLCLIAWLLRLGYAASHQGQCETTRRQ